MAIAFDAVSTGMDAADPTSLTWAHTCSGASRILVVGTSAESDTGGHTAQTVSSITYAGVNLTRIRTDYITDNGTELWYLVNPATGANNIIVTMTAVVDGLFGAGLSFTGVDQLNPIDNNTGTTTTGLSISQDITTNSADAMIVNIMQHYNSAAVLTPDGNQTQRFNTPTTGDNNQAGGTRLVTSATSYTTSWTTDISDGMTLSIVSLKAFIPGTITGLSSVTSMGRSSTGVEVASYSEGNWVDGTTPLSSDAGQWQGEAQSFTSTGGTLHSCKWYLKKDSSPTGNAVAKLYAHSGTYGTSSIPTGSALATSDNFDVSTLTTSMQLITFNFTSLPRYEMTYGTYYVITIEYSGGDATNCVRVGSDYTSPTASGNESSLQSSTWTAASGYDEIFYVYKDSPMTWVV